MTIIVVEEQSFVPEVLGDPFNVPEVGHDKKDAAFEYILQWETLL